MKIPFTIEAKVDFTPLRCTDTQCMYHLSPIVVLCMTEGVDDYGGPVYVWHQQRGVLCPECGKDTELYLKEKRK